VADDDLIPENEPLYALAEEIGSCAHFAGEPMSTHLNRWSDTINEHRKPHRGDPVAEWLKARRDHLLLGGCREQYQAIDTLLDDYRLAADTGKTLAELEASRS
jgi:hypothetical protein